METLALVFVLLIAGATTRATWRFGYTYLEEREFFERNKRLLDVKLPFWLIWIAGTLDTTGAFKAYILPFAPIAGVALLGLGVVAGFVALFAALFAIPALASQKGHEYEIAAPDAYIAAQSKAGEASRAYTKALVGVEETRRRVAPSIEEAEENLNRALRETARHRSAPSHHGTVGVVSSGVHYSASSTTVMRC